MPRMIDLIRSSALPATRMHAAARGALTVPAAEMIEILVHLANHNKIFAQQAKLTLAGWDESSALAAASDPNSPAEVLDYMISPQNLRPQLLPALLENPAVKVESIVHLASTGTRDIIAIIVKCKRCSLSSAIQTALSENPNFRAAETAALAAAQSNSSSEESSAATVDTPAQTQPEATGVPIPEQPPSAAPPVTAAPLQPETHAPAESPSPVEAVEASAEEPVGMTFADFPPDPEADEGFAAYMTANAAEIAAEEGKPFQPIGGVIDQPASETAEAASSIAEPVTTPAPAAQGGAAAAAKPAFKKPHPAAEGKRDNTLQKIAKLDVKGRIQLAIKGDKEERSLLIRDGTKIVALAVLESPKITDGEVERFASQKNVLEAVLRAIPMKRRFAKQYSVLRNLVFNPRTPIDVSLGLIKHMLVQDLKNLSGNKEVSDTVRKLALKMFKQKLQSRPGE